MDWLLQHNEDEDIDQPLTAQQIQQISEQAASFEPDPQFVEALKEMGFAQNGNPFASIEHRFFSAVAFDFIVLGLRSTFNSLILLQRLLLRCGPATTTLRRRLLGCWATGTRRWRARRTTTTTSCRWTPTTR